MYAVKSSDYIKLYTNICQGGENSNGQHRILEVERVRGRFEEHHLAIPTSPSEMCPDLTHPYVRCFYAVSV